MAADIVTLPIPERDCRACTHVAVGPRGTFCVVFGEWVANEKLTASDCPIWESFNGR